jgi:adenylate cyclase
MSLFSLRKRPSADSPLTRVATGGGWSFDWSTSMAGCVLIGLLVALHVWDPPLLQAIRLKVFDQYMQLKPRQPLEPSPVVVVDIDEPSLEQIGQWPWPRVIFAELIERLTEAGALVTAFDVIFAEPDRFSPARLAAALEGLDPILLANLEKLPSNDLVMANAMREHRVVLGQPGSNRALVQEAADQAPPMTVAEINGDPRPHLLHFEDLVRSVPVIEEAAQGVGLVSFDADIDGVVRRVPALADVSGRIVPTLAIEALRVATQQPTIAVRTGQRAIENVILRGVAIPTDGKGQIWVHYARPETTRYVSAADVLAGRLEPGTLAGKVVLVGTSAAGLGDLKATPLTGRMPGVAVHAQLLETIFAADHLSRPAYATGAERAVLIVIGLGLAIAGPLLPAGLMPVLLVASTAVAFGISWYAFAWHNMLIDGAYPAFALTSLVLWLALAKYIREQAMRRSLRSAFSYYLSPVMVDQLVADPKQLKLTGEARDLSVMFCDIRGFTTLTEQYADRPEEMTAFINRFMTSMTEEIMEKNGTIDKYIGDAIMAFWNAPLHVPNHAEAACLAALGMHRRVRALNEALAAETEGTGRSYVPLHIGIGINSGECYVGNMGSEQRFNYSAMGDPVNIASRLEGQTKLYGVDTVIGETTSDEAPDLATIRLDLVRLKGKTRPVWVFGVVGDAELGRSPSFQTLLRAHDAMLDAYAGQDWAMAERHLEECRACDAFQQFDTLYRLYDDRIAALRRNPPAPDWDGAYVALSK